MNPILQSGSQGQVSRPLLPLSPLPSGPIPSPPQPPHLVPIAGSLLSCAEWPSHTVTLSDLRDVHPRSTQNHFIYGHYGSVKVISDQWMIGSNIWRWTGAKYFVFTSDFSLLTKNYTLHYRLGYTTADISMRLWSSSYIGMQTDLDDWFCSHCY